MKKISQGMRARGFRALAISSAVLAVASVGMAQTTPAYQTAIVTGLGTANTAGEAILVAGAVIVVSMIVWRVIKRFAKSAG